MIVKLFILGLPGSGKSAIARYINSYVRNKRIQGRKKHWFTKRFNDYSILNAMANDENEREYFQPAESGGFDVIDFIAFDIALKRLEAVITNYISSKKTNKSEIIVIEFARNDYQRAFSQFNKNFLQDIFIIYLGADIKVCQQRISDRVFVREYPDDDYPVSNYIFEKYYYGDNGRDLPHFLEQIYEVGRYRVLAIDNNSTLEEAAASIIPFIDAIIDYISAKGMALPIEPL